MSMVNVMLEIPKYMLEGLKSGKYERVGGVVRDVHTKQIVGWLREAEGLKATVINTLNILGPAASVLNLVSRSCSTPRSGPHWTWLAMRYRWKTPPTVVRLR